MYNMVSPSKYRRRLPAFIMSYAKKSKYCENTHFFVGSLREKRVMLNKHFKTECKSILHAEIICPNCHYNVL
jgi:hypothetical protein